MGITIHWQGRLAGFAAYESLVRTVRDFAGAQGWPVNDIERAVRRLERVIDEKDVDYNGPTFGLTVWPHPNCEPVHFEFDETFFIQEYCKTQFAGAATHVLVVELLQSVARLFTLLDVVDEGEFWDSADEARLRYHIAKVDSMIGDICAEHPNAKSAVVLPSGRIVDVYQ